ncbi:death domain-associated protein 6 isoform X2 [Rhineura floridana]|uniref:death domain-associated protein 6 isoform X2 n=1 Tax=Rhineura floridana TaxID=261503 RepID=UPI002AC82936|nr:death domain-associated protein 6 isoform X2 [Rhineura floridana]
MSLFSPPGARRSVSRPPSDPLPPCDAPPARLSLRPLSPWGAAAAMASPSDSIIILDGDDDEDDGAPQPSPPPPPAAAAAAAEKAAEPPGPSGGAPPQLAQARGGAGHRAPALGKDPASLRVENERLFAEFIAFCSQHTADHQEVMPYLAARHQKASPDYLDSVEFRNVLGRCLTRVQARPSKVYVYINELCTVFRAHAQKKLQAAPDPSGSGPSAPCEPREGSKRQIRYLENLLRVCAGEIRKLQERELDLEELDNEDSAYMQESRLKRRMMRIFERLCQLKDCNSLTGRVIEQRIPYRGTRYPEVNRRIERLINHDPEAFPDYADILKVVQKASTRHSLNLPKRQMESMAADAFREVGNRLQERRHLDLIYNFGNHLTDQYRPNSDPALADGELARRLRQNRDMALRRLEQVTSQFAQLQDRSEEEEWLQRRRRGGRAQAGSSSAAGCQQGELSSPKEGSQSPKGVSKEAEWGEEEEEEEEEEESSSESDMEAELEKSLEDREDAEGVVPDEEPPAQEVEADQHMDLGAPELVPYSSDEEEEEEEEDDGAEREEGQQQQQDVGPAPADSRRSSNPPALGNSPSQQFFLEIEEALPLEAGETPPPTPSPPCQTEQGDDLPVCLSELKPQPAVKHSRFLENGRPRRLDATSLHGINGEPPSKRSRHEQRVSNSSCIEVPSAGSSEEEDDEVLLSLPPQQSPAPVADSTCADSPGLGLVTSSQGSPQQQHPGLLLAKTSVATQCDPEEIIILSDSD